MKGTIRNSIWKVYKIERKKEIYLKEIEKLIIEIDGVILNKEGYEREIAMDVFGKNKGIFTEGRYKIKLQKIDMLKDHGRTNYEIDERSGV